MKKESIVTTKEMKGAILRSGYLLEQRVEPILEKTGYVVTTNAAYPDPFTGKSREIDIEALSAFKISRDFDFIFLYLICECENNHQPLVFFIKDSLISFLFYEEVKSAGIPSQFIERKISTKNGYELKGRKSYIGLSNFLNFEKYHHYCKGPVSTQYCTFTRKNIQNPWIAFHSEIQHDSFTNLVFALEAKIDEYYKSYTLPRKNEKDNINIGVFYPVLILQGDLYSAQIKKGKLELKKSKHIQYRKEYFSKEKQTTYQIDVISESFLPKYLKMVDKEMEDAKKILKRKIKIVRESIEDLTEIARKKKKGETFREIFEF